jgi:hypothetical protein
MNQINKYIFDFLIFYLLDCDNIKDDVMIDEEDIAGKINNL